MIQLSKRLAEVASFVTCGNRIADVGTDHGYVPVYLVQAGKVPYAIAMDINKGPLKHAEENIMRYGLGGQIETRLSDGLCAYNKNEADTIIIAGMGGALIIRILSAQYDKWKDCGELILSPHSEQEAVRRYLCDNGMSVIRESMLIDDGKYYTVIKAARGEQQYESTAQYRYGQLLLERRDKVLFEYLKREEEKLGRIRASLNKAGGEVLMLRSRELSEQEAVLKEAFAYYDVCRVSAESH